MEVLTIKHGQSRGSIERQLKAWLLGKQLKGLDANKYKGAVKLKKDPVRIQKEMRDEWD